MGKPEEGEKAMAKRVTREVRGIIQTSKLGKKYRRDAQKRGSPAEFDGLLNTVREVEKSRPDSTVPLTAAAVLEYVGAKSLADVKTVLEAAGAQSKPGLAWWASVIRRIWKQRVYEAKGRHRKDQMWREEKAALTKRIRLLRAAVSKKDAKIQRLKAQLADLLVVPE